MAGIRPPQAYLALDMTDTAPLASLAADLTGGRTSGLRFLDDAGTLAIVLDVTGLAEAERQPLEDRLRDALLARSEEHTSELQSLMRISYAVFCLKKKSNTPIRRET